MSAKKAQAEDPVRRIALLWGSQNSPGRSGLTVNAIVTAAIELADASGLAALSMRSVAERVGAGTMSLYTHIPSKDDLVDLMRDRVYGQVYQSVDEPSQQPGGWRGALRFIARRNWDLYLQHPWLLEVSLARPVLGPHTSLKYEAELRPLDGIGLSDLDMDAVLTLVLIHTEGTARAQVAFNRTQQDTGLTDAEWWVGVGPLLDKVVQPERFPVSTRVGEAAGQAFQASSNPQHTFTFGLERILAGVAELIQAAGR